MHRPFGRVSGQSPCLRWTDPLPPRLSRSSPLMPEGRFCRVARIASFCCKSIWDIILGRRRRSALRSQRVRDRGGNPLRPEPASLERLHRTGSKAKLLQRHNLRTSASGAEVERSVHPDSIPRSRIYEVLCFCSRVELVASAASAAEAPPRVAPDDPPRNARRRSRPTRGRVRPRPGLSGEGTGPRRSARPPWPAIGIAAALATSNQSGPLRAVAAFRGGDANFLLLPG